MKGYNLQLKSNENQIQLSKKCEQFQRKQQVTNNARIKDQKHPKKEQNQENI